MTKRDFVNVINLLKALYPNFKFDINNEMMRDAWYSTIEDLEINMTLVAIKKLAMTEHFAPSIQKIRESYATLTSAKNVDDAEGWGLVMKAIRNFGYMRADEALASLPLEVQKAVEFVGGFKAICESEEPDVVRGQFFKAMKAVNDRVKTNNQLSIDIQNIIGQISSKMEMPNIEKPQLTCGMASQESNRDGIDKVKQVMSQLYGEEYGKRQI